MLTNNGAGVFSFGAAYSLSNGALSSSNHPAVVLDVNRDGRPDVVLALSDRAIILLGNGDGTFHSTSSLQKPLVFPAGAFYQATVVSGDFNEDGNPDLMVGPYVYLGRGDGYFSVSATYSTPADGGGIAGSTEVAVDLNGDGHLDLVWNNESIYVGGSIETALGSGDGTYKQPFQAPLEAIANGAFADGPLTTGDFNRDGIPDVAFGCSKRFGVPNEVCVFPGTGKGYLAAVQIYPLTLNGSPAVFNGALVTGDVNGDGILDLVATNSSTGSNSYDVVVLLGKADGTFKAPQFSLVLNQTSASPYALLVDINKDGKLDLAGPWGVALGNGGGTFKAAKPLPANITNVQSIVSADFNYDGYPDLAVISLSQPPSVAEGHVLLGDGSGTFPSDVPFSDPNLNSGLAVADINKDGIPDLLYGVFTGAHFGLSAILGKGNGSFADPTSYLFDTDFAYAPFGIYTADFNRDGNIDVFMTTEGHIEYFQGLSGGSFAADREYLISAASDDQGGAEYGQFGIPDLNGDGLPDIAAVDRGGLYGVVRIINTQAK